MAIDGPAIAILNAVDEGWRNFLAAVDELSALLREDLGIPAAHREETPDVPVSDMLTNSLEAYRSMVDGRRAMLVQDWAAAAQNLDRAVATDSLFAVAQLMRFAVHLTLSDPETAQQAIESALASAYRVPERVQLGIKAA